MRNLVVVVTSFDILVRRTQAEDENVGSVAYATCTRAQKTDRETRYYRTRVLSVDRLKRDDGTRFDAKYYHRKTVHVRQQAGVSWSVIETYRIIKRRLRRIGIDTYTHTCVLGRMSREKNNSIESIPRRIGRRGRLYCTTCRVCVRCLV